MGTWDVGPFDNDTAADWCGGLHDAHRAQRVELMPADVPSLALRALDRITADNSEWRDLWEEDPDSYGQAVAALLPVRTTLEQAST